MLTVQAMMSVARVGTVKEVDDEGAIVNGLAEVTEHINNLLHRLPILFNRHVALSKVVKGMTQEDGARFLVCLEVGSDGGPELVRHLTSHHVKSRTASEMEPYSQLQTQQSAWFQLA